MNTATISLQVDDRTARAFAAASDEQRRKLELLLRLRLKELVETPGRSLENLMDQISRHAAEAGLTPEILESLVNDDD